MADALPSEPFIDLLDDHVSALRTPERGTAPLIGLGPVPLGEMVSFAPGRVNLIGDHTDYTGGLAMPMAIHLGTEVTYERSPGSTMVELSSSHERDPARVPVAIPEDSVEIAMLLPEWSRHVAGVVAAVRPSCGGKGSITGDLPRGVGLSSSASLGLAVALALGYESTPAELARACQRAEAVASGVTTGILDQLAIAFAEEGCAMLVDCATLSVRHIEIPPAAQIVVVPCGVSREVSRTAYPERRRQCEAVEREIGPLRSTAAWEVDRLKDPLLRRRARHVVSENARVRAFAGALEHSDLAAAGVLMNDSHASLSMDFEVSIPELDQLVAYLQNLDGVFGARLTGAGFGGCAVALAEPGVIGRALGKRLHWTVRPTAAAALRNE